MNERKGWARRRVAEIKGEREGGRPEVVVSTGDHSENARLTLAAA